MRVSPAMDHTSYNSLKGLGPISRTRATKSSMKLGQEVEVGMADLVLYHPV